MKISPVEGDTLKPIRWWLYTVTILVAVMVLVGGATRLTDSGLSITEWAPISGTIPPLSQADWDAAFEQYKGTTEFQTINSTMFLEQFKTIFWWEWGHRFLGRLIGLIYALPLIFFWARGMVPFRLKLPLLLLLVLGGLQGFIGWWMVKSGLVGRVDVSQIRLALHLTLACIILSYAIWLARSTVVHLGSTLPAARWLGALMVCLILPQVFAGGLVAGLDAGMAFNTWPMMNSEWLPTGLLAQTPWYANLTDNAVAVQFNHRNLAYLIWVASLAHLLWLWGAHPATTHLRRAAVLFVLISLQGLLGIATLLMQVPLAWALLHQLGALIILSFAVVHWHAFDPALLADHRSAERNAEDFPLHYAHGSG